MRADHLHLKRGGLRRRASWRVRGRRDLPRIFEANDAGYKVGDGSWQVDEFVEAEDDLGEVGEGELLGLVGFRVGGGLGFDKGAVFTQLVGRWFPAEGAEIEFPDGIVGILCGDARGECPRPFDDLGIVQEKEGLGGDGGAGAAALAGEGFGLIEDLHHGDEVAALDHEVDAAAVLVFVEGAGAIHLGVELTGGGEDGIAHDFRFEPARGEAPETLVLGIERCFFRGGCAALQPGGARHDIAVE